MIRQILFTIVMLSAIDRARADLLSAEALTAVRLFRDGETLNQAMFGHETVVRLHQDAEGRPLKTARSALIISGLYNSPKAMRAFENYFFDRGMNVVNLRLAGHYGLDTRALWSVEWTEWRAQSVEAFALARQLGDAVNLVGHSTGGLLVTWLAVESPEVTKGLALLAPAFGLNPNLAKVLATKHELPMMPLPAARLWKGRRLTLHAGREVQKLGAAFRAAVDQHGDGPAYLGRQLRSVPVWMTNTGFDGIIDLRAAEDFVAGLGNGAGAARHHKRFAACSMILHDRIAAPPAWRWSWRWRTLRKSMERTLFP